MKKSLGTALFSFGLLGLCATAHAAEPYAGANIGFVDYSIDGIGSDASLTALYGRGGVKFADVFAVEGRLGLGVGDDSVGTADVSLNYLAGVYVLAGLPVTEQFFPYAVLGYSKGDMDFDLGLGSFSDSESDISYGVGVDFHLNETFTINGEYMSYLDKDGGEIAGFAIGASMSF